MGKSVTVKSGYSNVPLPQALNPAKPFQGGQTAILTDAEYAALPASVTRCLNAPSNVAEPVRTSKDVSANNTPNIVSSATGTVALKSSWNILTLTGNTTLTMPTTATVGSVLNVDVVVIQDATGGRTLTLPASVKKPGGAAFTVSSAANAVDFLRFITVDGGVTWLLLIKDQAFA